MTDPGKVHSMIFSVAYISMYVNMFDTSKRTYGTVWYRTYKNKSAHSLSTLVRTYVVVRCSRLLESLAYSDGYCHPDYEAYALTIVKEECHKSTTSFVSMIMRMME